MKTSEYAQLKVREHEKAEAIRLAANAEAFVRQHVPRWHQFLMQIFPNSKHYFNYQLAADKDDRSKLSLLKGKKLIASNF